MYAFTYDAWEKSFVDDITKDMAWLALAVVLVFTYTIFIIGNLSPVYSRSVLAVVGMITVFMGAASGYAVAFFF